MSNSALLPKYVCHKEVRALKIRSIDRRDGKYFVVPFDERFGPIEVQDSWIDKHGAKAGMYYVVYKDGYVSVSPARAFEEGYTAVQE